MGITKKAFTFIEIVVVIGVIGMSLPILFTIIFAITNQTLKVQRLSEVKKQGDYAINVIENTIRGYAVKIYDKDTILDEDEKCKDIDSSHSSNGTDFYIKDISGKYFNFQLTDSKIASESADPTDPDFDPVSDPVSVDLTSDKVFIKDFAIQCNRNTTAYPPIISISFNICYKNPLSAVGEECIFTRAEETASLYYQTKIKLRNY